MMTDREREIFWYGFYVGLLVIAAIVAACDIAGYRPPHDW